MSDNPEASHPDDEHIFGPADAGGPDPGTPGSGGGAGQPHPGAPGSGGGAGGPGVPSGGAWPPPPASWFPAGGGPAGGGTAHGGFGGPPYSGQPGYPGYGYYGQPQWNPPAQAGRGRRSKARPLVAAALILGTVAASAAITHEVWPSTTNASTAIPASGSGVGSAPYFGYPGSGVGGAAPVGGSSGSPASSSEGAGGPSDVSSIEAKVAPDLVIIDTVFRYQEAEGAGTGIVLTSTGEILTNNHVINGETSIKVTDVGNGKTYSAHVVGYDPSKDVAVLQLVDASGLKTASISSSAARTGQAVVAIGNAGGTGSLTPAGGSVTALDQSITASDELDGINEHLNGLIETNADVQAGDSGGPLVNTSGQVLGMDTAAAQGYSLQGQYSAANQGYAIPIGQAISIAKAIEDGDSSSSVHVGPTAFLGVLISSGPIGGSSFQGFGGYAGQGGTVSGAQVAGVVQGGAAAAAGLAEGDVITGIDGKAVTSGTDLSTDILGLAPGQTVQLTYVGTTGTSQTVSVTLQSGPPA